MAKRQERTRLNERERDRLKVPHEVSEGPLKQKQGAEQLGISERGFRKPLKRFRDKGDGAVHGLRARRSNRRLAAETAAKVVSAVKSDYSDFGPTPASEYLKRVPEKGLGDLGDPGDAAPVAESGSPVEIKGS